MDRTHGAHADGANGVGDWMPDPRWVHVEPDPSGIGARQIRHARYPYVVFVAADVDQATLEQQLFELAVEYLGRANVLLKLPASWIPSNTQTDSSADGLRTVWLPFHQDLRGSFWTIRYEDPINRNGIIDRTAVLLGSLAIDVGSEGNRAQSPLHGGQGLHVVAHCDVPIDGQIPVRFTSAGSTLPRLMASEDASSFEKLRAALGPLTEGGARSQFKIFAEFAQQMGALFGLTAQTVPIEFGIRVVDASERGDWNVEIISKTAPPQPRNGGKTDGRAPPWMPESSYQVVARIIDASTFEPVAKIPLVAHATADVLPSDPVTIGGPHIFKATRPHRPSAAFAGYLDTVPLWKAKRAATANRVLLEDTGGYFRILKSPLARDSKPYSDTKEVSDAVQAVARTNEFAAVNAYVRASEFIRRLLDCGFDPMADLRYLTFPLAIHYRGGIHPGGRDGKTVNAQVRWISLPADASGAAVPGTAEVSFALADLRLRQPLGIAADARWAWHEWSHVMLAGATGSLEFEFAHSAGDALAAIVADPDSALATHARWRGRTFPWVTLPDRFHSRDVREGWGWMGTLYQCERYFAAAHHVSEKDAYWSEQIHSSSLFRLYRALGGDTETAETGTARPNRDVRRSVADYVVYLILRGIATMGSASTHPIPTADGFVTQLINADVATTTFATPERLFIGGAAGKVIRWAYQQQGLYADPASSYPVDAPGLSQDVDIYIDDRAARHGGYEPLRYLDRDWQAARSRMLVVGALGDTAPLSKAKASVQAFLLVFLNNCGRTTSGNVTVRAWVAQISSGGQIPGWHSTAWQPLTPSASPAAPVVDPDSAGGGPAGPWVFDWTPPAAGKRYALLAEATCQDDPSNIDPATELPCATVTTGGADASDIAYLVSCDNNLGLIEVRT